MEDFIAISKALSDPHRVQTLLALRTGELCACQIIELLGLAPSTVSKHMSILKQAKLILYRKEERWMYYRLPDQNQRTRLVHSALNWIFHAVDQGEIICEDKKKLEQISKQDLTQLCKSRRDKREEK